MTVYVRIVGRIPSAKSLENSSFATSSFPAINMPSIRIVQRTISGSTFFSCIDLSSFNASSKYPCLQKPSSKIELNTQFEHFTQDRDSKINMLRATKAVNQYSERINSVGNTEQIHLIAQRDNSTVLFLFGKGP
ncbi:hypothetical protein NC651_012634 [Populus alba x Populus x berolinensis]|nr:hypothetical protein NC651_012634 [Populus alba x Populus x berolinensis]